MAKAKGKKGAGKDPHEPFDKVTLTGPDRKEHDVTDIFNGDAFDLEGEGEAIPLFPESDAEREQREAFYNTTPSPARERVDSYIHTISVGGSMRLEEKLDNLDLVTVQLADADGQVIATGIGHITAGFKFKTKDGVTIAERAHVVKLH